MTAWTELLLPSLLAAVLVFVASSLIHMVIRWHQGDYRKLTNEDEVRAALRKGAPVPGQYNLPHCGGAKDQNSPEFKQKLIEGPVATMFVRQQGELKLGPFLGAWFVYTVIVGLLAGYVAMAALPPEASYLKVFQVTGAAAWLAYAWGGPSDSIWKGQPWRSTLIYMFDGLIYAALTGGCYGWLWTR